MSMLNRRDFMKAVGFQSASLVAAGLAAPGCTSRKKPNILILFTDDQRFNTISALNCPEIKTPNIDRLVRNGMTFTRAHIMGGTSGAVCMPSRAMLLTGKTLFHLHNRGASIPDSHALMPETFIDAGYKTFGTGKWHNGKSAYKRCFTHGGKIFFGGMSNHSKVPVFDFDPTGQYPNKKKYIGDKFSSVLFSDEAVRFLEHDGGQDPFFMYVSYTAPHDPRMAPEEFTGQYPSDAVSTPKNFMAEHPFDNGEMKIRDEKLAPWPRTPKIVKEHLSAYYAMIAHTDAQIGRILDALERRGDADNTIIVFSGDNGLAVGCHGLLGKQNIYDHSVRVPLIISGPGIPKGSNAGGLCYLLDIFPTLCNLTGVKIPNGLEGLSLATMLKDPKAKVRSSLFLAYTKLHRGVRTDDDWKLIKYNVHGKQTTQLFDLNNDPDEIVDLADDEKYAEKLENLTTLLKEWMHSLDDFCDLDKPNWGLPNEVTKKKKVKHLAVSNKITLTIPCSKKYDGGGAGALVDGVRGTSDFNDNAWQGFEGHDLDAVIDLGKPRDVKKVKVGFLQNQGSWIFHPVSLEASLSEDGVRYTDKRNVKKEKPVADINNVIQDYSIKFNKKTKARYVHIRAKNVSVCPSWHQGAGGKAWLFADEIIVE